MLQKLLSYIRERRLIQAGERVGIAVSGGADSVALLRAMLELREQLGVVLATVHFNHGIRGRESDADAEFVAELAKQYGLEFHQASGDVPAYAKKHHLSTEAAARRLRYEMFRNLLAQGALDKIATAHTRDDQAETVLLRFLRGAGTRGLGGIHPVLKLTEGAIVRPMLEISRRQVETFLNSVGQSWREDSTNADLSYTRNRIRHQLLPLLACDYNPNIAEVLAEAAEIARDEDAYWTAQLDPLAKAAIRTKGDSTVIRFAPEATAAPAVRRRLLRIAAERAGVQLDFHHAEQVLALLTKPRGTEIELPRAWRARRTRPENIELSRVEPRSARHKASRSDAEQPVYEYPITIPGEVAIAPVRTLIRLSIVEKNSCRGMYNPASLFDSLRLQPPLVLRNWRPGDRMRPLHRGSEEKLKRLFQQKKIPAEERALWPVLISGDRVVWAKLFGVAAEFAADPEREAVRIEAEELLQAD